MVNILLGAFNSLEESRKGTLRSLIAFSFLVGMTVEWIGVHTKKFIYICIAYFLSLVLVTSAIGVQLPNTVGTKPATAQVVTYGLCLGLVVYGFLNINMYTMFKNWSFAIALRYTAFGIVSVTLSALFTYYCSEHANLF